MKHGPVPSLAYDIIKDARNDPQKWYTFSNPKPSTVLNVPDNKTVLPLREPNTNLLSKTDIECLKYAYDLIKGMSFLELKKFTHDSAYDSVEQDEDMSIVSIIETLDNGEEVLDYLNS
jgi:hypothetical protein